MCLSLGPEHSLLYLFYEHAKKSVHKMMARKPKRGDSPGRISPLGSWFWGVVKNCFAPNSPPDKKFSFFSIFSFFFGQQMLHFLCKMKKITLWSRRFFPCNLCFFCVCVCVCFWVPPPCFHQQPSCARHGFHITVLCALFRGCPLGEGNDAAGVAFYRTG